jgi:hypothetical protein
VGVIKAGRHLSPDDAMLPDGDYPSGDPDLKDLDFALQDRMICIEELGAYERDTAERWAAVKAFEVK